MGVDMPADRGKALDKIALLLAQLGDRSISAQEADELTDKMSRLIWEVSEPTSQERRSMDYSIHDAAHHQLYIP
jgi:hypothetical protein